MKDRIPLYPGRVLLIPVEGEPNKYTLTMADEPTEQGTPLNKGNLLSDATSHALFDNYTDRSVNDALRRIAASVAGLVPVAEYTAAGSYTWTCPEDGDYLAVIIGGGGSGAITYKAYTDSAVSASGGGSGEVGFAYQTIAKDATKNIIVGAGGVGLAVSSALSSPTYLNGNAGSSSSFAGVYANGGGGGLATGANGRKAAGGQPSSSPYGAGAYLPAGGIQSGFPSSATMGSYRNVTPQAAGWSNYGFRGLNGLPISMLCAGGSVEVNTGATNPGGEINPIPMLNGKTCSPGVYFTSSYTPTALPVTPTDCGAGSGGIAAGSYGGSISSGLNSFVPFTSAAGAAGGVFIYRVIGGTEA